SSATGPFNPPGSPGGGLVMGTTMLTPTVPPGPTVVVVTTGSPMIFRAYVSSARNAFQPPSPKSACRQGSSGDSVQKTLPLSCSPVATRPKRLLDAPMDPENCRVRFEQHWSTGKLRL